MARVQTDQLTFGDFTTGLSAEEHSRVCGILRAQSPNKRVELPWEEQHRILSASAAVPAPTAIPEVSAVEDQVAHAPAPGYVDSAPASLQHPDYVQFPANNRVDSSSESSYISSSDKQGYYQSPSDSVASSESESVKDTVKDNDSNGNGSGNNFNGSGKPKERRNKKKRPPNYYKDLEAGVAETVVTEVPALSLQRPVENHVDMRPPQRIPESSGQSEQHVPVNDVAITNKPSNVNVTSLPNDVPASPLQEPPRTIVKTVGEPEIKHRPNVDPIVPSPSVVVVPNGPVSPLPVPADAAKPSAADTHEVSSHSNAAGAQIEEEAGRNVSNPSHNAAAAATADSHNAMGESQEDARSEEAVNQSDDSQSEQSVNNSNPPAVSSPPPTTPKTWAGLFKVSSPQMAHNTPLAYVAHVGNDEAAPTTVPSSAQGPTGEPQAKLAEKMVVPPEDDDHIRGLGEYLLEPKVSHKPVALQPRGLINKGNWCYINATLQAMVACPPMYNLMKNMPLPSSPNKRGPTATPILDCLMEFMSEFGSMPNSQKTIAGKKPAQDLRPGSPFEPTYVYHMLSLIKSTLSSKGRQEDAEEFLSCVLNGIHEEMQVAMKMAQKENQPKMNGELTPKSDGPASPTLPTPREDGAVEGFMMEQEEGDDDEWEQVGPKNKSTVTRTANFVRTPISDIFGGQLRSIFHQHGTRESATLQPFFTLQLDIQSEKIWTVKDAMEAMVTKETIHGYTCSKTKQEVEASRRMMIEDLPPVLVLHLKRFVYDKTGGSQKVQKRVDFNIELDINKELLSPAVKNKLHQGQRTYRLFAVVYHHGKNATGGHYTTDVFHVGINGWLRFDDQNVKVVTSQQVMKYTPPRVPYLLYYRRCDLI
ncbi:ubiquitin carboxyl-terminal hydrolase 10-like isoform X2 [Branchiostoma lanceolatum]|uniref:ubiquitin carboxyl-terminal hydrolase 10-like isoform X2 n=1 Tax=Branchiostoma lanceolatum TaxID=7740 RepID=UPI003455007D